MGEGGGDRKISMDKPEVTALVISSLGDVLAQLKDQGKPVSLTLDQSTYLLGHRGVVTSLGLVTLIVDIEQKLNDDHGITITLADERAMSQEKSPFRTVGSLVEYICLLMEEKNQNG